MSTTASLYWILLWARIIQSDFDVCYSQIFDHQNSNSQIRNTLQRAWPPSLDKDWSLREWSALIITAKSTRQIQRLWLREHRVFQLYQKRFENLNSLTLGREWSYETILDEISNAIRKPFLALPQINCHVQQLANRSWVYNSSQAKMSSNCSSRIPQNRQMQAKSVDKPQKVM